MNALKRSSFLILAFALILPLWPGKSEVQAAVPISIYLNGTKLVTDAPPYLVPKKNITMVPLRAISTDLGAIIGWSQERKTATIQKDGKVIEMTIGANYALVNGERVPLEESVQVRNNRTLVPLRFVSVQLGLKVTWYQSVQTIKLESYGLKSNLRGAWISTVYNLDWPTVQAYGNPTQQKQEYAQMLDELQASGINTVFVQVRPAGDALYPSALAPWSKVLTGTQGADPGYDPLAYMIEETHRRGMEFHAWFNPFRGNTDGSTIGLAGNHAALTHPEWVVTTGPTDKPNKMYLNPGLPDVRQHIVDAVLEVVKGYAVDGVHLDDYFYPSGELFNDDAAFKIFNLKKFATKAEWRRDNINQFIQLLDQSIHRAKPGVKFGVSPFGVWRNQSVDPTGSDTRAGVSTYDDMHADVRTWIRNDWIDYVIPQIYWSLTFEPARYDKLADWWVNEVRGTNVSLYIGHASYKLGTAENGWSSAQQIVNQLKYNERHPEIGGSVYFRARTLQANTLGVADALREYYLLPANR